MKRIAIDMDEVIADFVNKHLNLYNRDFNECLSIEDLNGTRLWKLRPHFSREIFSYVNDPTFFRDLRVIDGSQEVIQALSEKYEIFITCRLFN